VTTLGVVIPSYGRPDALARCLAAIRTQQRTPDDVVVALRAADLESAEVASAAACRVVTTEAPGVLAAMIAGTRALTTDLVCFTDDDAVAPSEWLVRLVALFDSSPRVGGAGGRDVIIDPDGAPRSERLTSSVGRVAWFGRHVGNHHVGSGPARDVAFLKGVNSAYRRAALGLPVGLRGDGAEAHYEIAVGRYARSKGWRLVYDPSVQVEHHPAPRKGIDQREGPDAAAVSDASYNLVVAIGGARGLARVPYAVLAGDRGSPGLARAAVAAVHGDAATRARLVPSLRGTIEGGWALMTRRGVRYETFA
jgi:GT2 family glycosyltransferase